MGVAFLQGNLCVTSTKLVTFMVYTNFDDSTSTPEGVKTRDLKTLSNLFSASSTFGLTC